MEAPNKKRNELTLKQKKFVSEYIKLGNATQAAIKAGYSKATARSIAAENLSKPYIQEAIESRIKKKQDKAIAQEDEILEFYTKAMRGKLSEEQIVVEGNGDGYSTAKIMKRKIQIKDRINAAKELYKRYRFFEETDIDITEEVNTQNALIEAVKNRSVSYLEEDE